MTNIQYIVLCTFLLLIIFVIGYYIYQDYKFKKIINNSFSSNEKNIINKKNDFVFDTLNIEADYNSTDNIFMEDSLEAKFALYDKIINPFATAIDKDLDYIIDIIFEERNSIKPFVEVQHYLNNKKYSIYLLDDDNIWHLFTTGLNVKVKAIKYVINFVDSHGIINNSQIKNLYNELYKFVLSHNAHIRQSDYPRLFQNLSVKLKNIKSTQCKVDLFLLFKNYIQFNELKPKFDNLGLIYKNNCFYYQENNLILIKIINDNKNNAINEEINILKIIINFELATNPLLLLDKVLDIYENLVEVFDVRLLTSNKTLFADNEYNLLEKHILKFSDDLNKLGLKNGDNLLLRIFGQYC
jgi:hypothetical protein